MVVFTQLADRLRGENVHIDDGYRKLIMASQPMVYLLQKLPSEESGSSEPKP